MQFQLILLAQLLEPLYPAKLVKPPELIKYDNVPKLDKKKLQLKDNDEEKGEELTKPFKIKNDSAWLPKVLGTIPYDNSELRKILNRCKTTEINKTLTQCAVSLNSNLVKDGYINSRVFILKDGNRGALEVVEGRISELRIISDNSFLEKQIQKKIKWLKGSVLHLPSLEKELVKLRAIPGVGQISGDLGRLGSDATKAVLRLNIDSIPNPWSGEYSFHNDGNIGSGQWRNSVTLEKRNLLKLNDNFASFLEVSNDSDPELGALITSNTYSWSLSETWQASTSFAYNRSQFVEFAGDSHDVRFDQYQINGQIEKKLYESSNQIWNTFSSLSLNHSSSYLDNERIALVDGGGAEGWLKSGQISTGLNFAGRKKKFSWNGTLYGSQALAGISTSSQISNFKDLGVDLGEARAIGARLNLNWKINSSILSNMLFTGQSALNPLPNSMAFSLGSDSGIKGLPGSLVSGDNGWAINKEFVFTTFKNEDKDKSFSLIPSFGIGAVRTDRDSPLEDRVGSTGIVGRYIKRQWLIDIGWFKPLYVDDNSTDWNNWLLGDGVYTKVKYRF